MPVAALAPMPPPAPALETGLADLWPRTTAGMSPENLVGYFKRPVQA